MPRPSPPLVNPYVPDWSRDTGIFIDGWSLSPIGIGGVDPPAPEMFPGKAGFDGNCGSNIAITPQDSSGYQQAETGKSYDVEAIATPRGIIKVPDACRCSVDCDNNFEVTCTCPFIPDTPILENNPRLANPGEFGRPEPSFVSSGPPYTRDDGVTIWSPGGISHGITIPRTPVGEKWKFK
jgi:hypothetical protein